MLHITWASFLNQLPLNEMISNCIIQVILKRIVEHLKERRNRFCMTNQQT